MKTIEEARTSLDVLQEIIAQYPEIQLVKCIRHDVALNWGQKYDTNDKIVSHFKESLVQEVPLEWKELSREDLLKLKVEDLQSDNHQVWSFTSKVQLNDGTYRHIPMMNFHPLKGVTIHQIIDFIRLSEGKNRGVILESGRYFHYYGHHLLTEEEWLQFNARFLMPMILVRSRYIGHRLRDGYSTLRLTRDDTFKPKIPQVVHRLNEIQK